MPKIVVKRKAEVYKEFPIRPFQNKITIGSEGDNDLIIADKRVSMHHLAIEKEGTNYFVQDNNSAFGTLLNGEKVIERTLLASGDEIHIGEHSLIFENILFDKSIKSEKFPEKPAAVGERTYADALPESSAASPDIETEVDIAEGLSAQLLEDGEKIAAEPIRSDLIPHYLVAIYGPYTGKKYRLNFGITRIGRDTSLNDIVIRENSKGQIDPSISRRHATISLEAGNFFITDKRSKTRTRVNQRQLNEDDTVQLFPGDEIEIVSDQRSTIFRLTPETKMDYAAPRRAGIWWVRNGSWVRNLASVAAILIFALILFNNWRSLGIINQKPGALALNETTFIASPDLEGLTLQPTEVMSIIPSLAPAAADFNGDGFMDIVYLDKIGYLKAFDGKTSKPLWQISSLYQVQLPVGIVVADLNNNNLMDILIPSNNSIVYAVDGQSGTEIWASPLLGGVFAGNPIVTDLNGDNIKDIFICNQNGKLHLGLGTFTYPEWSVIETENEIRCAPSAGDLDGDGLPEVVFGTEGGLMYVYDGESNSISKILNINEEFQKAKGSFFEEQPIRQRIAVGDLNQDNCADLAITTERNHILTLDGKQFKRLWFDEFQADPEMGSFAAPVMGDFDGNNFLDVAVVTNDNKVIVYDGKGKGSGQKKINWGYIPQNVEQFISQPVLADVNKDDNVDILLAGFYHGLYIFDGSTGKLMNEANMGQITSEIIATPIVADFNKNNSIDILLRKNSEEFTLVSTNSKVQESSVIWGQVNFNPEQSGCIASASVSKSSYYLAIVLSLAMILFFGITLVLQPLKRKRLFSI
ncbi:MAG: FHA domain-containing protein [Candidatus Zhuqueibacterota bacterium]